jgi:hypothetical protein
MTDRHDNDFDFSKDLEIDVDVDLDFDVDVDVDVNIDKCIDIDIYSDIDLDGNSAELSLDAQAIGDDTLVEVISVVLTTDDLSSVTLNVISATD